MLIEDYLENKAVLYPFYIVSIVGMYNTAPNVVSLTKQIQ